MLGVAPYVILSNFHPLCRTRRTNSLVNRKLYGDYLQIGMIPTDRHLEYASGYLV